MSKREFNPKSFLIIFSFLSLASVFLLYLSSYTAHVYSDLFEEERFGKGAKVSTISIEELTIEEAQSAVNAAVGNWEKDAQIFLIYNEQKVKVDTTAWVFNVKESIDEASSSSVLKVALNEEEVKKAFSGLQVPGIEALLNEEMLFAHLKAIGANLQTNSDVELNEFLTTFGQFEEVVSEGSLKLTREYTLLEDWIKGLNGYEIKPGKTFSLQRAIEEAGMTPQDSIDLNVLANGIYKAVQKTNFTLVERHTSRELPDYSELGYEAFVKPADMDLEFKNPNGAPYKLNFVVSENNLIVTIIGVPLPYSYKIKVDKQLFEPKTIIHFNKNLADIFSSVVVDGGSDGYLAAVYRESYGSGGELVESVKIAEDFYPPKHRIEERGYPIEKEEQPSETSPVVNYAPYPWYPYPYPVNPLDPAMPMMPGIPGTAAPIEEPADAQSAESNPPSSGGEENGGEAK
jgi:hypothetical protein